jgi:hypothetical protein
LRIGEIALCLWGRLVGWRCGGLPFFLWPLASRLFCFSALGDPGDPLLLVGDPVGQFVATLVAVQPVVCGLSCAASQRSTSACNSP